MIDENFNDKDENYFKRFSNIIKIKRYNFYLTKSVNKRKDIIINIIHILENLNSFLFIIR